MLPVTSERSFPTCQQVCAYTAITALAIAAITMGVQQIPTLGTLSVVPISIGSALLVSAAAFHALWHRPKTAEPSPPVESQEEQWALVEKQCQVFEGHAPNGTYWSFDQGGAFYLFYKQDGSITKRHFTTPSSREAKIGRVGCSDAMEIGTIEGEQARAELAMTQAPHSYLRAEYEGKHILYVEKTPQGALFSRYEVTVDVYQHKFGVEAKLLELEGYKNCEELEGVQTLKGVATRLGCAFSPSVRYDGFETTDKDQQAFHQLAQEIETELFLKAGALLGKPIRNERQWRGKCTEYLKAFWKVYQGELRESTIPSLLQYQSIVQQVVSSELADFGEIGMSTLIPKDEENNMSQLIVVIAAGWKMGIGHAIAEAIEKKSK